MNFELQFFFKFNKCFLLTIGFIISEIDHFLKQETQLNDLQVKKTTNIQWREMQWKM